MANKRAVLLVGFTHQGKTIIIDAFNDTLRCLQMTIWHKISCIMSRSVCLLHEKCSTSFYTRNFCLVWHTETRCSGSCATFTRPSATQFSFFFLLEAMCGNNKNWQEVKREIMTWLTGLASDVCHRHRKPGFKIHYIWSPVRNMLICYRNIIHLVT